MDAKTLTVGGVVLNIKDVAARTTAAEKYNKPSGGIPSTDMTIAVQTSLDKADNAVQIGDIVETIND